MAAAPSTVVTFPTSQEEQLPVFCVPVAGQLLVDREAIKSIVSAYPQQVVSIVGDGKVKNPWNTVR